MNSVRSNKQSWNEKVERYLDNASKDSLKAIAENLLLHPTDVAFYTTCIDEWNRCYPELKEVKKYELEEIDFY